MPCPHDTEESVSEQQVGAYLRRERPEHPNLKICVTFPERAGILGGLRREAQPCMRCSLGYSGDQRCRKQSDETFIGADRERPVERGEIDPLLLRTENVVRLPSQRMNAVA